MGLGVLCLESYWSSDHRDRRSVRGLLDLLEHNMPGVLAVHRHVAGRTDFERYMEQDWACDQRYDVLYVAAHGSGGGLFDERGTHMPMSWLRGRLKNSARGRVIFLAGCGTMDVTDRQLQSFTEATGAIAFVGYGRPVEWLEAAQMDLIVLGALARHGPGATGAWTRSPTTTLEHVYEEHRGFADRLEWQFYADPESVNWKDTRRDLADGAATALEELARIALDDSVDLTTRQRATNALGALRARSALTTFTALSRHPGAPVELRLSAVRALADIPGGASVNSLRQLERRFSAQTDEADAPLVAEAVAAALRARVNSTSGKDD